MNQLTTNALIASHFSKEVYNSESALSDIFWMAKQQHRRKQSTIPLRTIADTKLSRRNTAPTPLHATPLLDVLKLFALKSSI